jgi:hypothetical protein
VRHRWRSVLAAAAAALLATAAARADVAVDAGFGFDGAAVPGFAAPVRVSLSSTEKGPVTVALELAPGQGVSAIGADGLVQATEVYLPPGAKKRLTLPVVSRGLAFGEEWILTVRTDRRTLLRHGALFADGRLLRISLASSAGTMSAPGRMDAAAPVLGILGDPGNRLGWLETVTDGELKRGEAQRDGREGLRLVPAAGAMAAVPCVVPISPESAPDSWIGYEGFDAVLWLDPDPAALGDPARLDALLEWAVHGGRLLVALTPGARIPAGSALALALPVEALGHDDAEARDLLAVLTGSGEGVRPGPVPVARCGPPGGRVEASFEGRPLVVARSHGMGSVRALAFDPRLLRDAAATPRAALLHLLLGSPAAVREDEVPFYYAASPDRLLGHLRKRFVKSPPLALLILGLVLYVVAIGPLDYFLLKRRGKLRRTVVTFPLIVLGFTVTAYASSFLLFGASGGQARVAVLDFATSPARDADAVRGIDLLGAYSPVGRTLEVTPGALRSLVAAPWISASNSAFEEGGGLKGVVVHAPDGRPTAAVDIPLRSFRAIQTRFSAEVPAGLDADVVGRGGGRRVRIVNRLAVRVRDLCLVDLGPDGDPRASAVGDLDPGATVEVDPATATRVAIGGDTRLPDPFESGGGLFSRSFGGWGSDEDAFVPRGETEEALDAARAAVGRAILGASLAGVRGSGEPRQARLLARHGIDLSRAVREGRPVLLGWCHGDPVPGLLPDPGSLRSTVTVVRRVLPAEEAR